MMENNDVSSQMIAEFSRNWCQCESAVRLYFTTVMRQNPSDVPDLVQRTAIAAFRKFGTYDRARSFKAWILGFACYEALARKRDFARSREYTDSEAVNDAVAEDASAQQERQYRHRLLHRAMERLQPKERQILNMQYVERRKMADIAAMMKMNEGALRTCLSRLRDKLRGIMMALEQEDNQ